MSEARSLALDDWQANRVLSFNLGELSSKVLKSFRPRSCFPAARVRFGELLDFSNAQGHLFPYCKCQRIIKATQEQI